MPKSKTQRAITDDMAERIAKRLFQSNLAHFQATETGWWHDAVVAIIREELAREAEGRGK